MPIIKKIRLLFDEEIARNGEQVLREMIPPGIVYEIATPTIAPDDRGAEAAYQLQQLLAECGYAV